MSIFRNDDNQCEICKKKIPPKKKRCDFCNDHFDSKGEAFVIYCEFWIYGYDRDQCTFWVFDNIVQRAPDKYKYMVGGSTDDLQEIMAGEGLRLASIDKH